MVQVYQNSCIHFYRQLCVLLIGGLVHDYGYKYATLLKKNKKDTLKVLFLKREQTKSLEILISSVNGFYLMNYLTYWSLRLGAIGMEWSQKSQR